MRRRAAGTPSFSFSFHTMSGAVLLLPAAVLLADRPIITEDSAAIMSAMPARTTDGKCDSWCTEYLCHEPSCSTAAASRVRDRWGCGRRNQAGDGGL